MFNKLWQVFLLFYVSLLTIFVTMKCDSLIEKGEFIRAKGNIYFLDIEAAIVRGKQHIIEIGAVKWLPNDEVEFFLN